MPRKPLPSTIICYHCDSNQTRKAGLTKFKKQRYYCRSCRRFSRENPKEQTGRMFTQDGRPQPLPGKSRLALELQSIAQRIGRIPTLADIRKLSKTGRVHSIHTYYKVFSSFPEALKVARLKMPLDPDLEKEILLGELRALHEKLKRPLIERDVAAARKKRKVSSLYKFVRVFGSVPKALAVAGVGRKTGYSREELIEILRRIAAAQDRPVTDTDIDKHYQAGRGPSHRTFEREFGGMTEARRAAGILNVYRKEGGTTRQWQKYTIEELVDQLQALGKRLGRKPTDRDINRASKEGLCASAVTFVRAFGSLTKAYRRSGFERVKPHSYTDREILSALKTLIKEKGGMPTFRELARASKAGKSPAPGTIIKRFGSLKDLKEKFNL
jgi:hypothetical protein